MTAKESKKGTIKFSTVTEKFCSRLGDNAIIVTIHTEQGKEKQCLCANRCKAKCEHNKDTQ